MNPFDDPKELQKTLIGLSPEVFFVTITGVDSGFSSRYSPTEAAEWVNRYTDSIITSTKDAILMEANDKQFKLAVWQNVPQRVNLSELSLSPSL